MSDAPPTDLADALRALRSSVVPDARDYVDAALAALEPPAVPGRGGAASVSIDAPEELASLIDHTQLHPDATDDDIDRLCDEATTYGFAAACVHPVHVPRTARALDGTDVQPCTVIGFPHGAHTPETKAQEAAQAVRNGARECDMVQRIGALKSGRFADVEADIRAVVDAARNAAETDDASVVVKVILETTLLTDAEIAVASIAAVRAGADFVKTSTGFASGGATVDAVALMRQVVGDALGVKASGGVGSAEAVEQMVAHGATRIGASGSVAIMDGAQADASY